MLGFFHINILLNFMTKKNNKTIIFKIKFVLFFIFLFLSMKIYQFLHSAQGKNKTQIFQFGDNWILRLKLKKN